MEVAQVIERRGAYYSDFRVGGRRIQRFLSKEKREAQIELGKLLEQMRGDASGRPSRNISWKAFKEKYLIYSEGGKKPKSVLRDRAAISALDKSFPIAQLSQVTPELLEQWKGKRLKAGKGKATINRDINAIKALLHKAEAWGYLDKKDWGSVKEIKTARKKLYFHTPNELWRLLQRCHGVWHTICLLGARAGLRREEMHMLAWEDVDFQKNRLHITPKDEWEPKDYEQRFVPLADDLRKHLLGLTKSVNLGRWVLGEDRPRLGVMSAYFQKLTRKENLRGSLHILRHTFASHLIQSGVSLKVVKDLLGHSDMKTTEIYAELIPENFEEAVARLPKISSSGVSSGRNAFTVGHGRS